MRRKAMIALVGATGVILAPLPALAQVEEEEAAGALFGGAESLVIPLLSIAAVIGGISIAAGDDETSPTSP